MDWETSFEAYLDICAERLGITTVNQDLRAIAKGYAANSAQERRAANGISGAGACERTALVAASFRSEIRMVRYDAA